VDWYNVSIANAIEALPAETIADECVDLSSINNPFCASVTRGATAHPPGLITLVKAQQINVAQFGTSGIDMTANYHIDTADLLGDNYGALDFHLIGNYLDTITQQALPDEAHEEHANEIGSSDSGGIDGGSTPRWQFNLDTVWSFEKWTVDVDWDWYNGVLRFSRQQTADQPDIVAPQFLYLPPRDVFDVQVGYDFAPGWNGYAGVNNIFYQKPAIGGNTYPVDPLGRFFYMGVKADLDWGSF
jgi:outer membrane receptor protein involved in Fe transport